MKKRIFISFPVEDKNLRDLLVGQARNDNSPFEFIDMSVKTPWDSAWKTNCRTKIKGCDGLIAIITKNSKMSDGELWEVKCAIEEEVPCIGICTSAAPFTLPPSNYPYIKVINWDWYSIAAWMKTL